MEKYGIAGQTTDDDIIQRMRIPCCVTQATYIFSDFSVGNSGYANAPRYVYIYIVCLLHFWNETSGVFLCCCRRHALLSAFEHASLLVQMQ